MTSASWLDQLNSLDLMPKGMLIENVLCVAIALLLYVAFEIIHNAELAETKAEQEARRRARLTRLTGG